MDSAEFLDLLGNENRRRILQLLARKPCYVTEISEFLGVSPKAVIDHLRKLEDAGLVDSRTDERRRKYFSINRHVRLEVTVSPYEFGTKSAYPASTRLDLTSCRRISIDLEENALLTDLLSGADDEVQADEDSEDSVPEPPHPEGTVEDSDAENSTETRLLDGSNGSVVALATQLHKLEQLERELSLAQRWTQGRATELRDALAQSVGNGDPRLISELLLELADEKKSVEELGHTLDAPVSVVEEILEALSFDGVVYRDGHEWSLDADSASPDSSTSSSS
jgi:ArsR family transcriptional regulator